jgi:hypothetical protein
MIGGVSVGGLFLPSWLRGGGGVVHQTITRVVNNSLVRGSGAGMRAWRQKASSSVPAQRESDVLRRALLQYPTVTAYLDALSACQHIGYFCASYARTPKYQNHCVEDLY